VSEKIGILQTNWDGDIRLEERKWRKRRDARRKLQLELIPPPASLAFPLLLLLVLHFKSSRSER